MFLPRYLTPIRALLSKNIFQNLSSGMLHWSERHCKPEHLHHIFEPGISSEERHPNPMRIVYQERLNEFSCFIQLMSST